MAGSQLQRKLLDVAGDLAPDLNGLTLFRQDVTKGRVGCFELDATGSLVQLLDCQVTIHDGDYLMTMTRLDRPVDHQNVAVKDAGFDH